MSLYRSRADVAASREELAREIARAEALATPAFWDAFEAETGGALGAKRAAARAEGAPTEALAEYLALLEGCVERAPEIEWELRGGAEGAPAPPEGFEEARGLDDLAARRALEKVLGGAPFTPFAAPRSRFDPHRETGVRADAFDPPFWLQHRLFARDGLETFTLRTSLSRAAPAFGSLWARLRGREVALGGGVFGGTFEVLRGDEAVAARVLAPEVRAALLRLARFDAPDLELAPGSATLRFRYGWDPRPLRDALGVLRAVRALRFRAALLRWPSG